LLIDKIKVALIYRVETVTPIGVAATTTEPPFNYRRLPLAHFGKRRPQNKSLSLLTISNQKAVVQMITVSMKIKMMGKLVGMQNGFRLPRH